MAALSADEYAQIFQLDLHAWNITSPRSLQAQSGQIGISDLGTCMEQTRRVLAQEPATDSPSSLPAIVGSWVDGGVKTALAQSNPHLLFDLPVRLTLPNGFVVPGTLDVEDPTEPSVTDVKSKDGLEDVRYRGGGTQNRWQRHGYYAARWQAGALPREGITRNVYVDRSGQDERVHVEQEPFKPEVLDDMSRWLDVVVDAHLHGDEAPKDQPRPWCQQFCQFYTACRGDEVGIGWAGSEKVAETIDAYAQAAHDQRVAAQRVKELRPSVTGITGRTSKSQLVSTNVNPKSGRPYTRVEAKLLDAS